MKRIAWPLVAGLAGGLTAGCVTSSTTRPVPDSGVTVTVRTDQPAAPADSGAEARVRDTEPIGWGPTPPYEVLVPVGATRPIPYPIDLPPEYLAAVERGTRGSGGSPGPLYWQQWADYRLEATLEPEVKRLSGRGTIVYRNNSPDELDALYLHLTQNVHAPGALRNEAYEVTGGIELSRVVADGKALAEGAGASEAGYRILGTILEVELPRPLGSGGQVEIQLDWSFRIPQLGAGARMGWNGDDLLFLAYWYPQMAVYDDLGGWHLDPFLGAAEFYTGFGSYDVTIDAPVAWLVRGTGRLENPEAVLREEVLDRLRSAETSDTIVHVLGGADLGSGLATRGSPTGRLRWRFRADTARDMAFSATRASLWDAARTSVGDRDGDRRDDFSIVEALYRTSAPRWAEAAAYSRHAIDFHSRFTGLPYPWPHMVAVEGGGIIGGGMEFPMLTLIGDYNARGDSALYYVTAHELAHMWVPMIVGTDERRHAWMDEGMTSFLENQARKEFFPGNPSDSVEADTYLRFAAAGAEGEMMRWTDYQYPGAAGVASYSKPATVLVALRALLGERAFLAAYRTFLTEWAWRHPKPWDFFRTFERIAERDLGWFWRSWYYETWALDQAIEDVAPAEDGTRVVISDLGRVPMPVRLLVSRVDGSAQRFEIPVDAWLTGATRVSMTLPGGAPVIQLEIDPEGDFPDADRENNIWVR